MQKARFSAGTLLAEEEFLLSQPWNTERAKSSAIDIIPFSGIIKKSKVRSLDKAIYEVFASIFFAELVRDYNPMLSPHGLRFYAPQAVRYDYGNRESDTSLESTIYELFCPGTPLNKVQSSRKREHRVGDELVRVDQRALYLGGAMAQILAREGVVHGDPQLRHFLLLPGTGTVREVGLDGVLSEEPAANGLGIIDVEHAGIEGKDAEGVRRDVERLKSRLLSKFGSTPYAEDYFQAGYSLVESAANGFVGAQNAYGRAADAFQLRFPNTAKRVDMGARKIIYH